MSGRHGTQYQRVDVLQLGNHVRARHILLVHTQRSLVSRAVGWVGGVR